MVQAIKRDEVFIEPEGIHVETHSHDPVRAPWTRSNGGLRERRSG